MLLVITVTFLTFFTFFKSEKRDFLRFLLCFTRFLEPCKPFTHRSVLQCQVSEFSWSISVRSFISLRPPVIAWSRCRHFQYTKACRMIGRKNKLLTREMLRSIFVIALKPGTRHVHCICRVSAVGCTNMIPPENAWLRRSNNDIIIGCYSSQQTWQLNCDGREWKGLVGTCPELCK